MKISYRTLLWLCGVSLLGNLFLVGYFLVPLAIGPDQRVARLGAIAAVGRAPKEVTDLIESDLEADKNLIRGAFEEVRGARRAVRETMRAEPFDAGALDAAFATLRQKSEVLQQTVHRSVARAVAAAPAEARAKIEDKKPRDHR